MTQFLDSAVSPGFTGAGTGGTTTRVQVYRLTSGVFLPSTIFPAIASGVGITDAAWLNFTCDDGGDQADPQGVSIPFWVNTNNPSFGPPGVPDPTANVTDPSNITGQCLFVDAGKEWHRRFIRDQPFRAIQFSGNDAFLRVEMTSELNV
ncbi:MAG: hypothetical protein MPL62_06915 [Alphaproteobacteria bacterium]|nr:hypothetical protein [Alphaproteobacteria bacterium]